MGIPDMSYPDCPTPVLQKKNTALRGDICCQKKQEGTALLVGLVMIFMMTVLGLTAMRESSLEKRMTTNSVHKSTTLQAAESASDLIINNTSSLNLADSTNGIAQNVVLPTPSNSELVMTGTVTLTGGCHLDGFSTGGGFIGLRYEIEGTAAIDSVQSSSTVKQGACQGAPAPQSQ